MATTALGIMQDSDGNGVSPLTHRKVIQARWSNTGVITGLAVTGSSNMKYTVAAGCAVVSRSESDGYAEAYWEGGETDPVASGDPSNPRIDIVWIKANDKQQGDPDNLVHIGVTSGTPSADPVAPTLDGGCTEIARVVVPAGASSTSSTSISSNSRYAIPQGASLGLIANSTLNYDGPSDWYDKGRDYYENMVTFTIPTDRIIEFRFTATASAADSVNITRPTENDLDTACWYVGIQLDNEDIPGGGGQFQVFRAWEPVSISVIAEVSVGTHTARTRNHRVQWGNNIYFRAMTDATQTYQGRTLEVWDRGVSR